MQNAEDISHRCTQIKCKTNKVLRVTLEYQHKIHRILPLSVSICVNLWAYFAFAFSVPL